MVAELSAAAKDTSPYLDASAVDFKTLLGNPPAAGSPTEEQEIDVLLQDQQTRTPDDVKRIKREADHLDVFLFDTVTGPWFQRKNLPVTAALFNKVHKDADPIVSAAKKFWDRPRPYLADSRIHPSINTPGNAAYPSGHSSVANLDARILAELIPDEKDAILARGREIGNDRVLAGVHFPSDVAAGEKLAQAIFARLMANPVFIADLTQAKGEIAAARVTQ
jgi:hypothetical protein